jgi:hypothetical protein
LLSSCSSLLGLFRLRLCRAPCIEILILASFLALRLVGRTLGLSSLSLFCTTFCLEVFSAPLDLHCLRFLCNLLSCLEVIFSAALSSELELFGLRFFFIPSCLEASFFASSAFLELPFFTFTFGVIVGGCPLGETLT